MHSAYPGAKDEDGQLALFIGQRRILRHSDFGALIRSLWQVENKNTLLR
jgi:hypothetical protein